MTGVAYSSRRFTFSAAHRYWVDAWSTEENERFFGRLTIPHGHNYTLEVTVRGEVAPGTGMVMNLTDLMEILQGRVLPRLDHKHLNLDVPSLRDVIPTAENIAIALWNEIEPEIRRFPACRLHRIRLQESRANSVEYFGPER